jgi:hypothetical protein
MACRMTLWWGMRNGSFVVLELELGFIYRIEADGEDLLLEHRVEIERPCVDSPENTVALAGVGFCFDVEVLRSLERGLKVVLGILTYALS